MTTETLSEPLLGGDATSSSSLMAKTNTSSLQNFNWPSVSSSAAKLFVPLHWRKNGSSDNNNNTCTITYDNTDGLLKVMNNNNNDDLLLLDMMDPNDIIGANLEICQENNNTESATTKTRRALFRNALVNKSEDTTTFNNNNTAVAYLNIYCYPRTSNTSSIAGGWCAGAGWVSSSNDDNDPCGVNNNRKFPPCTTTPNNDNDNNNKSTHHRHAHHRRFELVPSLDLADIQAVVSAIRSLATTSYNNQDAHQNNNKFLVLVNPQAGTKIATKIYETIVKPMLQQAGIHHDVYLTESNRDAEQYMRTKTNLLDYTAYICMGGDGVLHETIQGIKAREDADLVRKKLALGVVGCGTGNGLAKSILHASEENYSQLESVFVICKGKTVPMDLSTYQVADKTYASFLTFSWSMIADIDLESEYIRCLGSSRFDIWAVWRVLNLRKYRAKLSYLPPNDDSKTKGVESLPPLNEPVPSDWKTIEGEFILFWASQVTHAAVNTFHCPPSKMQDGLFHILIVRAPASRFRIASLLLALEHGTHVNSPIAEFVECVAYRLEPMTEGSFNDLDGEAVESGPIQGKVEPAAIRVFCTPIAAP